MADIKGRIVFLEHYLIDHADEEHPILTDDLISILSENSFGANRNTLRDDITALQEQGVSVASVRIGNAKGYYIKNRPFKTTELKTLIDAVSSSQFISERNSNALIKQLSELAPEHYREDLRASAYASDRIKTDNSAAFAALDKIYNAVKEKKQISFQYVDYLPTKEEVLRHKRKRYVVSPYALLWSDGRYYAPSYDKEKGKIVSYRVDRMRSVAIVDKEAELPIPFDPVVHAKTALRMFDGDEEEQEVVLLAENKHMISILDRFGHEVETRPVGKDRFLATIKVIPSNTFFSWVFQFNGGIIIAGPEKVKTRYEEMLQNVLDKNR